MDKYYSDANDNTFYSEQDEYCIRTEISAEEYEELFAKCTNDKQFISDILRRPVVVTKQEIEHRDKSQQLYNLRKNLSDTDYIVTKLAEMQLTNDENFASEYERYAETIKNREAWRKEANSILTELSTSIKE